MNSSRRQRVAVDARWVFRELSGIGRYTLELLRQLGEIGGGVDFLVLVRDAERRGFIEREAGLAGSACRIRSEPHGVYSVRGRLFGARLLRGAGGVHVYHSTTFMVAGSRRFRGGARHAIRACAQHRI
jgi:hypothetical protein